MTAARSWSGQAPLAASAEVIVVGAGSAGATAAVAAARTGASVTLIEKAPFLGGTSTAVLDTFYGFYTPGTRAMKVAGGISDDVVAGLRALGPVLERANTYGAGTGVTYNPEHLKVVWEDLATRAGVRVMLHAFVQAVDVEDGHVREVLVATKAGLVRVAGQVFVDASGDADLVHQAGFGHEMAGALAPAQTLTTTFRLANVDIAARRRIGRAELHRLMADAAESGAYDLPRREGSDHVTTIDGVMATVMTRLPSTSSRAGEVVNASDPELLSEAEMQGRRQALEYARFLRERVPGYERSALIALSSQIGVRETRRVFGDYRLTGEDVLGARHFEDEIGLCGAPIEDHHGGADTRWQYLPDGETVGIPYRTLIVRDSTNTLVAGRCFSATHEAHASVRSMAQTMAMGQAAGTAAAMATEAGSDPRGLDIGLLRERLRTAGAVLEVAVHAP
jgi:2-polyprenyl-6-methoxyphenol hydroxylase-like FAD-dependent oxidoreductase